MTTKKDINIAYGKAAIDRFKESAQFSIREDMIEAHLKRFEREERKADRRHKIILRRYNIFAWTVAFTLLGLSQGWEAMGWEAMYTFVLCLFAYIWGYADKGFGTYEKFK